jgi:hypothetical protein
MAWIAHPTAGRGRRRLTLAAAAALTALTFGIGGAAAAPAEPTADAGHPAPGFLLERGRFHPVTIPPGLEDLAPLGIGPTDLNDRDHIVGAYDDLAAEGARGFLLKRGRFTKINPPGAKGTQPQGINNRGQIVGVAPRPEDLAGPPPLTDMPAQPQRSAG